MRVRAGARDVSPAVDSEVGKGAVVTKGGGPKVQALGGCWYGQGRGQDVLDVFDSSPRLDCKATLGGCGGGGCVCRKIGGSAACARGEAVDDLTVVQKITSNAQIVVQ